ncbi:pyridoxal phosphate-dependent transferase [Pisolithus sp. B1]|nr:pyridoxal phosphate-dependent transferase [Pisolithus sp. B1]
MMLSVTENRLAQLAEDVRCDVHSRTQDADNDARRAEISRTFISPTKEMNEYAIRATLGDDVFFEPSTAALESHVAKLTGKEAGLFMPTGTMSNQVALRTHLQQPPYSVLCDARAHIYRMEGGGIAFHSGANVIPVFPENGHHLTWEDIEPRIVSGADVHIAPTRIISLESTLNGTVIPQEDVVAISKHVRDKGIIMHLDGARLWHVTVATGLSMKELCEPFNSISLCFSKGLVGHGLSYRLQAHPSGRAWRSGSARSSEEACDRRDTLQRQLQYALTHHFPLLPRVHALAKRMQEGLEEIGVGILSPAETCMLFYDPSAIGRAAQLPKPIYLNGSRLMMHIQTAGEAVEDFLGLMRQLKEEKAQAGWRGQQADRGKHREVYVRCGPWRGPRGLPA